jgi:hypothetical protein
MTEKELRVATGDALVDSVKNFIAELQAKQVAPEKIKQEVASHFALDNLGSVGRLIPTGLVNGPDAQ